MVKGTIPGIGITLPGTSTLPTVPGKKRQYTTWGVKYITWKMGYSTYLVGRVQYLCGRECSKLLGRGSTIKERAVPIRESTVPIRESKVHYLSQVLFSRQAPNSSLPSTAMMLPLLR